MPGSLPIDVFLDPIAEAVRREPVVLVAAAPGAGKTTRVPWRLLQEQDAGNIVVLEPRRLAARMAATYVARALGESVGGRVGYVVRFDKQVSAATRLFFVTEGVFLEWLQNPKRSPLENARVVVFDEFHERHLTTDLSWVLFRKWQETRPHLRAVVMSATLNIDELRDNLALPKGAVFSSEGRSFPLTVHHQTMPLMDVTPWGLARALPPVLAKALRETSGNVLVFLPGMAEIRRAQESCASVCREHKTQLTYLHGDLSPREQQEALGEEGDGIRRVVLSTNVAESSVTVPGVTCVVDSGLARVSQVDPWTGLSSLEVRSVSQASAIQRAGRAGRVAPGVVYRLFTQHDFSTRPDFDAPELVRSDLTDAMLRLLSLGHREPMTLPWLTVPPSQAVVAALQLLERLGAIDAERRLTLIGTQMADIPAHPRLARLALEAGTRGAGREGARLAALLSERDAGNSRAWDLDEWLSQTMREGLPATAEKAARQIADSLPQQSTKQGASSALAEAVLAAFPDRVAKRVSASTLEYNLCQGGRARLDAAPGSSIPEYLVAIKVSERDGRPVIHLACGIEAEDLFDMFSEKLVEKNDYVWNDRLERVEQVSGLYYDSIAIEQSQKVAEPSAAAGRALWAVARKQNITQLLSNDRLASLAARLRFARQHDPELPELGEAAMWAAIENACAECVSLSQLREADIVGVLVASMASALRKLDHWAPESIVLPHGKTLTVHYEPSVPPYVESYLQDFFGMAEAPKLAGGRASLIIHLWGPNKRPLQVTSDLSGFWRVHYPELVRQLSRRYPRHYWPENPLASVPRKPTPRRS